MHYRVEIQRKDGLKLQNPVVVFGQLVTYTRALGERSAVMLQITDTGSVHQIPTLYSPTLSHSTHEGLQFSGLEVTEAGAWVAQSWRCFYSSAEEARAASEHQPTIR